MNLAKFLFPILMACQSFAQGPNLQIWYIPFEAKTDRPITRKLITSGPNILLKIYTPLDLEPIRKLISNGQDPINEHHIRLKLYINNELYFFDSRGNGVSSNGKTVKIDKAQFDKYFSFTKICFDLGQE